MKIAQAGHAELQVRDLEASKRFWIEAGAERGQGRALRFSPVSRVPKEAFGGAT
jgi:hypothetical protein